MRRGAHRSEPLQPPVPPSACAARLRGRRLVGGVDRTAAPRRPYRPTRSVPRRARGGAAARRPGAPSAPLRRPSPQPGAYLCAAPRGRGARAEHLTVNIAHGALTRRPFLAPPPAAKSLLLTCGDLPGKQHTLPRVPWCPPELNQHGQAQLRRPLHRSRHECEPLRRVDRRGGSDRLPGGRVGVLCAARMIALTLERAPRMARRLAPA